MAVVGAGRQFPQIFASLYVVKIRVHFITSSWTVDIHATFNCGHLCRFSVRSNGQIWQSYALNQLDAVKSKIMTAGRNPS